ncbi:MAG: hypothetical protein AAGJ87_06885 [Pseudomonadota bacterium]
MRWMLNRTMRGEFFFCPNGIDMKGVKIAGAFRGDGALIGTGVRSQDKPAIDAERAQIERGVFLSKDYLSFGYINFRRSRIYADFDCVGAVMAPADRSDAYDTTPTACESVVNNRTRSKRSRETTLGLSGSTINGNLDLSNLRVIQPNDPPCKQRISIDKNFSFAIYANRVEVSGAVFMRNGFAATGTVSLVSAEIAKSLYFEPVIVDDIFLKGCYVKELRGVADGVEREEKKTVRVCPDGKREEADPDGSVGKSWRLDLETARIGKMLSLRLMMSGVVFVDNDLSNDSHESQFSIRRLEENIMFWTARENARHENQQQFYREYVRRLFTGQNEASIRAHYPEDSAEWLQAQSRKNVESRIDRVYRKIRNNMVSNWYGRSWRKRRLFDLIGSCRYSLTEASTSNDAQGFSLLSKTLIGFFRRIRESVDLLFDQSLKRVNNRASENSIPHSRGHVDLTNAYADTYLDDFDYAWRHLSLLRPASNFGVSSWPRSINTILEGFTYTHFGSNGVDTLFSGIARIKWLKTQYVRTRCFSAIQVVLPWATVAAFASFAAYLNLSVPLHEDVPVMFTVTQWVLVALAPFWIAFTKIFFLVFRSPFKSEIKDRLSRASRRLLDQKAFHSHKTRAEQIEQDTYDGRINWSSYRSHPWLQAATALRESGSEQQARRILLSRERLNTLSPRVDFFERILRQALLITFGRGLVRWYPVCWFVAIYAAAFCVFQTAFDLNMMRPAEAVVLTHLDKRAEFGDGANRERRLSDVPSGYDTPRALVYAFEIMTPGLPMRQENRWAPCPSEYIARNFAIDAASSAALTRVCRPLQPQLLAQRRPLGAAPFLPPARWSLQIPGDVFNGSCGPLLHKAQVLARETSPPRLPKTDREIKQALSAYYRPMTIEACFVGIKIENQTIAGAPIADRFFQRDMLRQSTWVFIAYGWVLLGGLAVSLSQILLREA